jgi:hypothetical protein
MPLNASYTDTLGNSIDLTGESVEELAADLPEDYDGPTLRVTDEPGSVCGWIKSRTDWRAE